MKNFSRLCMIFAMCTFPVVSVKAKALKPKANIKPKAKSKSKSTKTKLPKDKLKGKEAANNSPALADIPCAEVFWDLYKQKNELKKNDCSNKCAKYYKALKQAGFKTNIVILKPWNSRMRHAIVRVEDAEGKLSHFDPVRGIRNFKLEDFGRVISVIEEKDFNKYGGEFTP